MNVREGNFSFEPLAEGLRSGGWAVVYRTLSMRNADQSCLENSQMLL